MIKLNTKFFLLISILLFVFQISINKAKAQCDINSCADAPVLEADDPVFDAETGGILINNVTFGKFGCSEPTYRSGASIYIYQLLPNGERISSCTVVNAPPNNFVVNVVVQFGQVNVCDSEAFNFGTIPATPENGFIACDGGVYEVELVMFITELPFDEQFTVFDQLPSSQYITRNLGTVSTNFTDEFPTNADPLTTSSIKRYPSGETGTVQLACGEALQLEVEGLSRLANCPEFDDITTGVPSELSNEFYYSIDGAERIILQDASTGAAGGQLTGVSSGSAYCYAGLLGIRTVEFDELTNIVDGSNVVFTVTTTDVFTQQTVQDQITIVYLGDGCPPSQNVEGCTDINACNYNSEATIDDGSCTNANCNTDACIGDIEILDPNDPCNCLVDQAQVLGCTDNTANNFNPNANCDDDSCDFSCPDPGNCDDGDCINGLEIWDPVQCNCISEVTINGCTDMDACNYNPAALCDDGSCLTNDCLNVCGGTATPGTACDDGDASTINDVYDADCNCVGNQVPGCTDANACNYDMNATVDDGSCITNDCLNVCGGTATPGTACDDGDASTINDVYDADCNCIGNQVPGCTDAAACNYNMDATVDDESCRFESYYFNCKCEEPCPAGFDQDDMCNCNSQCPTAPSAGEDAEISICANDAPFNLFDALNGIPDTGGEWYFQTKADPVGAITNFTFTPGTSQDGEYLYFHFQGDECEFSSASVTVNTNGVFETNEEISICEGESYALPNGDIVTEASTYQSSLTTVENCDSIINTTLTITPLDCEGVCGGGAVAGATCTDADGNAGTYSGNCECTPNPIPGCTDNDACNYDPSATESDDSCTYPESENVNCEGDCIATIDCENNCGGSAIPGAACDDGDPNTENDIYNADCTCNGLTVPPTCNAQAGELSVTQSGNFAGGNYVCFGNAIEIEANNFLLDAIQNQYYVFHTNNINDDGSFPLESIVEYGNTLTNNLGQVTIYATAIGAADDGSGQPEFDDPCIVYSNTITINLLDDIAISLFDDNCNPQFGEYSFTLDITGGLPGSLMGQTYGVTGDVYTGNIIPGQSLSVGPIAASGSYTVIVTDENACTTEISEQYDCSKLPISLIDFSGEVQKNGDLLKWVSASEINNDYYRLQHSADGKNFNTLATINGAGTTSELSTYSFFNRTVVNGNNYYRLLQTDFDNTTVNVGLIELMRSESAINTINIYPIPSVDILYMEVENYQNAPVYIYNAAGQKIKEENYSISRTKNLVALNIEQLASGVYIVNVVIDDKTRAIKFIKK